jgi:uncharacterized membrane protein YdjX (TVP38/TMEM64 family)
MMAYVILFAGAFATNVAVAILPHEPLVIAYGRMIGVPLTAAIATAATVLAFFVDGLLFRDAIARRRPSERGVAGRLIRGFERAPFLVLSASGLTPFPAWPFKLMAFATGYPTGRYLLATALGRFPRYAVLASLGSIPLLPGWVMPAGFTIVSLGFLAAGWRRES